MQHEPDALAAELANVLARMSVPDRGMLIIRTLASMDSGGLALPIGLCRASALMGERLGAANRVELSNALIAAAVNLVSDLSPLQDEQDGTTVSLH
jgi:hypothetical protein